jgi:hypothetical protein
LAWHNGCVDVWIDAEQDPHSFGRGRSRQVIALGGVDPELTHQF